MIGNILDNTTELYMIKYTFGEIFSSGGATLCKDPFDQTVSIDVTEKGTQPLTLQYKKQIFFKKSYICKIVIEFLSSRFSF